MRDEIGVVPPALDGVTLSLSAELDAQNGHKKIDVSATVRDAAGVDDDLYYSFAPEGGGESAKTLMDTVTAGGAEKALAGAIDLSGFADGTYTFCFWVSNSEGVTSDRVAKTITVSGDSITGDLTAASGQMSASIVSSWRSCCTAARSIRAWRPSPWRRA